jgi:Ca-activated chloride channel family protein
LTNENPFTITLSILGVLAAASFKSPSHRLNVEKKDGETAISLKKGQTLMDRDFVLNLFMETEEKSVAHLEPDGDGHVALASFYPRFPSVSDTAPRCITIIVDCSGSMGGDSIAQARKALYEILELLRPEDKFNVVRFGSSYQKLFPAPVSADAGNLKKAKNLLEVLDADMGGTEIGQAVAAAIKGKIPGKMSKDALLITDGEVWDWEKVTAMAAKSRFRFFTVGVGSSVSKHKRTSILQSISR